jgi:DNA repair protein RecN (Recombination protein N)
VTAIFDEIDTGTGGAVAEAIGLRLKQLAATSQVMVVTHLPQVAAQAASHLVVTKDQSKDRAVVGIAPIQANRKARVSELARMLGDRTAKSALAHAEELLGG